MKCTSLPLLSAASSSRCSAARRRRGRSRRGRSSGERMPVVGFLSATSHDRMRRLAWTAFRAGTCRELGWIDGRNVAIEYRWAEGRYRAAIRDCAAELVGRQVDVIVAISGTAGGRCSKGGNRDHPDRVRHGADPVGSRPRREPGSARRQHYRLDRSRLRQSGAKWLELLKEIVPRVTRVGILVESANPDYRRRLCADPRQRRRARASSS